MKYFADKETASISDMLEIIIITYNRFEKLDKTLGYLFDEKSPVRDYEITVINNKSTDNTIEIIEKWQKKFPNLKCITNKYNIGGNANIVKAFYMAKKEYVWVLADNDSYCWDSWKEVEASINNNDDAIMVSKHDMPEYNIAQLFIQTTFLPSVIYKTSNLDNDVLENMTFNISNLFPHLALSSKLINENKKITIVSKTIVKVGNNKDEKTGIFSYTRGNDEKNLSKLRKNMSWITGYANSLQMIKNKSVRYYMTKHNLFYMAPLTSARIFFLKGDCAKLSFYNLMCVFNVLNLWGKIKFVINLILSFSLFRIIYIYAEHSHSEDTPNILYLQYRIVLFNFIKTKLFRIKRNLRSN